LDCRTERNEVAVSARRTASTDVPGIVVIPLCAQPGVLENINAVAYEVTAMGQVEEHGVMRSLVSQVHVLVFGPSTEIITSLDTSSPRLSASGQVIQCAGNIQCAEVLSSNCVAST